MVNRSKGKGTWTETAVVKFLQDHGFPYAERRALAGSSDLGDITGTPGIAWEVKYGGTRIKMGEWIAETQQEKVNARADYGVLVIKPPGVGATRVGQWYAVMVAEDFDRLTVPHRDAIQQWGDVQAFSAASLRLDVGETGFSSAPIAVITRRPPGTKDSPEQWYKILVLDSMVQLLRWAGYGTQIPRQRTEDDHMESADLVGTAGAVPGDSGTQVHDQM